MNPNQTPNPMQTPAPMPAPMSTQVPAPALMSSPSKMPSRSPRALLWILAIIIVIGVVFWYVQQGKYVMTGVTPQKFSSENVKVTQVNVATATGTSKLPNGFPTDIPVELANITDSSTLAYPEHNTTLYTVTYISTHPSEELYANYTAYLKKTNYTIGQTLRIPAQLTIQAVSSKGSLFTVITPKSTGGAEVQLAFTVRNSS